jgi:hypothetical protein
MISISSYLMQGGQLVPLAEFRGPIEDEDYIEGALELSVQGNPLLTTAQVDYVDQLWAYLIQGMTEDVKEGQPFTTGFPDCPIEVTLRPDLARQQITCEVDLKQKRPVRSATAPLPAFKQAFVEEGRRFLQHLIPLVTVHKGNYQRLLQKLDTI